MERVVRVDSARNIQIVTGELPNYQYPKGQPVYVDGHRLIIHGEEQLSASDLLRQLVGLKLKKKRLAWFYRLRNRVILFNTIVAAFFITLFLGLFGAFGNAFYEVLLGHHYEETILPMDGNQLLYSMIVFFFLAIVLFPKFVSGDFASVNEWLEKRFSNQERLHREISQEFVSLIRQNRHIDTFVVVNPWQYIGADSLFLDYLLPRISKLNILMSWSVCSDEVAQSVNAMKKQLGGTVEFAETKSEVEDEFRVGLNGLPDIEQTIIKLLLFCSSFSLDQNPEEKSMGSWFPLSIDLAGRVVERYSSKIMDLHAIDNALLHRVIQRCMNDYHLLRINKLANRLQYEIRIPVGFMPGEDDFVRLKERLQLDIDVFHRTPTDAIASLILFNLFGAQSYIASGKVLAAELLIRRIKEEELYLMLHRYGDLLFPQESVARECNVFKMLQPETLLDLGLLCNKSGHYDEALQAFSIVETVYPFRAGIGTARVLERQGAYREALTKIRELELFWKGKMDAYVEDKIAYLELHLEKAWIIVSARFEDARKEGEASNQLVGEALKSFANLSHDIEFIYWHYNNLANYFEWDEDYQQAIEAYNTVLSIPGIRIQPVSSIYINTGISYRFLAQKENDAELSAFYLTQSLEYLDKGVALKKRIGDLDQLPIAIHNLSETLILQAFAGKGNPQDDFLLAYEAACEGLEIQQTIGSVKKRGQLLSEALICICQLDLPEGEAAKDKLISELVAWRRDFGTVHAYDLDAVVRLLELVNYTSDVDLELWLKQEKRVRTKGK